MGSLDNARHTIDTRDEFYDAESTFFDESWPQLSVYFQRLNEAMLDSKFRPELEAHYGSLLFLKLEISRRSFKPELVELMQEENRLTSRYQKLYANMTVEFDGKTMPMPMLGKYKVSADRAVRRAAYEAEARSLMQTARSWTRSMISSSTTAMRRAACSATRITSSSAMTASAATATDRRSWRPSATRSQTILSPSLRRSRRPSASASASTACTFTTTSSASRTATQPRRHGGGDPRRRPQNV